MDAPTLTFYCELDAGPLRELFATPGLHEDLVALRASVSLGLLDLGPERAEVVRRLTREGVPVIAWLLLSPEQGYWFNTGNVDAAAARYEAFRAWTKKEGLEWAGVGLDIEPDMRDVQELFTGNWRVVPRALSRMVRGGSTLRRAREGYAALVERIRADGYRVDAYQFPFILDERQARSTLLQKVAGVLDLKADREVLMLYSSFARPLGPALLWSYGPGKHSIAVGVTGGGVQPEGVRLPPPLTWDELSRDLRLAVRWTRDLHVFSLEGCVQQDFLSRLRTLDWDAPVEPPLVSSRRVDGVRRAARAVLGWTSSARP
ncbi:MAG TPA: hypothetical protein VE153_18695 [Myxococcus sp.]|nr:hypothetical protein [Myxococcus sp.]